jgi:hypothetical protein
MSPRACVVTTHQRNKHNIPTPQFKEEIDKAIQKNYPLWVKYGGGATSGQVRKLQPLCWENDSTFSAVCFRSGTQKKYFLKHVLGLRTEPWNSEEEENPLTITGSE